MVFKSAVALLIFRIVEGGILKYPTIFVILLLLILALLVFFFFKIYLFLFFWLWWVFIAECGLSLVAA